MNSFEFFFFFMLVDRTFGYGLIFLVCFDLLWFEFKLESSSSFAFSSTIRASFFKLASFRARLELELGLEISSSVELELDSHH